MAPTDLSNTTDAADDNQPRPARPRDLSVPLAYVATVLFGLLGLIVVLLVSFRHSPPRRLTEPPAAAPQPAVPAAAPANALTSFDSGIPDASAEGD